MTHRDRAGDTSGHRAGRREAAGDAGHRQGLPTPSPIHPACRFACATGTAVSPSLVDRGFRAAHSFEMGRMASDVPHRYATRSWPKALGSRLYGSLSTLLGMRHDRTVGKVPAKR
jgi:hypothetical protein